jgi:hypothetical protein
MPCARALSMGTLGFVLKIPALSIWQSAVLFFIYVRNSIISETCSSARARRWCVSIANTPHPDSVTP